MAMITYRRDELGVTAARSFVTRFDLTPSCVVGSREPGDETDDVLARSSRRREKTVEL